MPGPFALLNADLYVAGHDFTGDTNNGMLNLTAVSLDASTFGSNGWMENAYGLRTVQFQHSGFWQSALSDSVDDESFGDIAVPRAHTWSLTGVETEPAWMFNAAKSNYQLGGTVGPLAPFSLTSTATDKFGAIRGQMAKAKGAMTATGALGSVVQLGAVGAAQYLYATFHVFTAGTTATIQVQSDDNAGMTTPTTVATIGPLTTRGGTFMTRVAGPITDTFYRFNVSAITGAFVAAGAIGIGS
jgi:hypothetical protein